MNNHSEHAAILKGMEKINNDMHNLSTIPKTEVTIYSARQMFGFADYMIDQWREHEKGQRGFINKGYRDHLNNYLKNNHSAQQPTQESIRWVGKDNPWPLVDVLKKLSDAAKILLNRKNYDGPDYEEIEICVKRAEEINKEWIDESEPTQDEEIN
jgi:hypothetical protein